MGVRLEEGEISQELMAKLKKEAELVRGDNAVKAAFKITLALFLNGFSSEETVQVFALLTTGFSAGMLDKALAERLPELKRKH